jgi:uncharacterized protein YecE (DUF72 family)
MTSFIGTSGFQYSEWKGSFYPETLPKAEMLPFYAERFATTEINYTFRRIPSEKTVEGWLKSTPAYFKFSLKAPQRVTHFAKLRNCAEVLDIFISAVSGLHPKLGPILFQLPPTFEKDAALLKEFLDTISPGIRVAMEFRHASWFDDEVYARLHEKNAALCIAESSELSTPSVATAGFGYLRLRREDYRKPDLVRWAKVVEGQQSNWSEAFIYFKHEHTGVGVTFAQQMKELLAAQIPVSPADSNH